MKSAKLSNTIYLHKCFIQCIVPSSVPVDPQIEFDGATKRKSWNLLNQEIEEPIYQKNSFPKEP